MDTKPESRGSEEKPGTKIQNDKNKFTSATTEHGRSETLKHKLFQNPLIRDVVLEKFIEATFQGIKKKGKRSLHESRMT